MKPTSTMWARAPWLLPLATMSLLSACQPKAPPAEVKPVVWVSTAQAAAGRAPRVFSAVLQPRVESPVGFRVGGRITLRLVETGQRVKAGEPIISLDDSVARADLLEAQANLENARRANERATDLGSRQLPVDDASRKEAQEFLRWAAADHFTFFGYREYRVQKDGKEDVLAPLNDTGLGLMKGRKTANLWKLKLPRTAAAVCQWPKCGNGLAT